MNEHLPTKGRPAVAGNPGMCGGPVSTARDAEIDVSH